MALDGLSIENFASKIFRAQYNMVKYSHDARSV